MARPSIWCAIAAFVIWPARAMPEEPSCPAEATLRLGQTVRGSLRGGERNSHWILLEPASFVFARLYQQDVDVVVRVIGPSGERILEVDDRTSGPEFLSLTSNDAGRYGVEVEPFNPMADTGTYSLTIEKLQKASENLQGKVDELFAEFDNASGPGCAVAIVRDGQIIHTKGYGLADLERRLPIMADTRLNICSIGKQLTAFAVADLEAQGSLSLDEDIRKY
ncbi:MAG: serine hydrolase, partial [Phycisphaerae bacterium]|nr:serine hydrolase [Phycisphaerae bacterium]